MKSLRELSNNNHAVSPVIGEILLIAIVVILGAIIASFAFGSTDSLGNKNYLIGMSVDKVNEDNIVVTFMGGGDADNVMHLYVSVNGSYFNETTGWSDTRIDTFDGDGVTPIKVGKTVLLIDSASYISSTKDYVIITAGFMDGTEQVVLQTNV